MGVRQLSPGDRRAGPRPGPTLRTEDGVALATTCWLADTPSPATVVICHGFTANKADPKVVALAELLCAGGHEVITYDARGHGDSGGTCTLGKLEGLDVAAVVEWAATRGNPMVLIGASMGAVAALSYAADHDSLAGVIAISRPGDWRLPLRVRSLVTAGIARRGWAAGGPDVRSTSGSDPGKLPTRLGVSWKQSGARSLSSTAVPTRSSPRTSAWPTDSAKVPSESSSSSQVWATHWTGWTDSHL